MYLDRTNRYISLRINHSTSRNAQAAGSTGECGGHETSDDRSRHERPGQTFVQDYPSQSRKATQVITKQSTPNDRGFIYRVVLCELVWVFESAYGYSKDTIVAVLEKLLRTSQLKIEDVQAACPAVRMYQEGKADFADCLPGANYRIGGCEWTVTFDQPESKFEGFQLL